MNLYLNLIFFLVGFLMIGRVEADYQVYFKLNTKVRTDSSSYIHFQNQQRTTFYDRVNITYSGKIVSSQNPKKYFRNFLYRKFLLYKNFHFPL